jgi:hypothetical protein
LHSLHRPRKILTAPDHPETNFPTSAHNMHDTPYPSVTAKSDAICTAIEKLVNLTFLHATDLSHPFHNM